jgi:hypothetical protein
LNAFPFFPMVKTSKSNRVSPFTLAELLSMIRML